MAYLISSLKLLSPNIDPLGVTEFQQDPRMVFMAMTVVEHFY